MSKSLGNVIDPTDVIQGITLEALQQSLQTGNLDKAELKKAMDAQKADYPNGIPECGADALRFTLCSYVAQGRDVNMSISKVETFRKFCNKLWNVTKFALSKFEGFQPSPQFELTGHESPADLWILARLQQATADSVQGFEAFNLMSVTVAVHGFLYHEFCGVYVEYTKPSLMDGADAEASASAKSVLYYCLEQGLRLLHPFMPYVTEELYQRLPRRLNDNCPSISISAFPEHRSELIVEERVKVFDRTVKIAEALRSVVSEQQLNRNSTRITLYPTQSQDRINLESQADSFASLIKSVGALTLESSFPEESVPLFIDGVAGNEEVGRVSFKPSQ